jgi:precorrin-6B methylase 2
MDDADYRGRSLGPPILFTNQEIRIMLSLGKVVSDDIFLDLGCGWGQNLIIALTEFNVKYAIGFERNSRRYRKAVGRIRKWGLRNRCEISNIDFVKILRAKDDKFGIGKATVVFFGLTADKEILDGLRERLGNGCRLLYYYNGVFPEIMPEKSDFPFYVSRTPFKETFSELEWLQSIIPKKRLSVKTGKPSTSQELWQELRHDYDVYGDRAVAISYQRWMRRFLKKKEQ